MSQNEVWLSVLFGAIYLGFYVMVGRMIYALVSEKVKPITKEWVQIKIASPKTNKLRLELGLKNQEEVDTYFATQLDEISEAFLTYDESIDQSEKKFGEMLKKTTAKFKKMRSLCPTSAEDCERFNNSVRILNTEIVKRTFKGSRWMLLLGALLAVITTGLLAILPIGYYLASLTPEWKENLKDKMIGSGHMRFALDTVSDSRVVETRYANGTTTRHTENSGLGYLFITIVIAWFLNMLLYPFKVAKLFYRNYVY